MADINALIDKLKTQKGITIDQVVMEGANHFFENHTEPLIEVVGEYVDRRVTEILNGGSR